MITIVWPAASTVRIDAESSRSRRFWPDRKRGLAITVTTISSSSAARMPSSRTTTSRCTSAAPRPPVCSGALVHRSRGPGLRRASSRRHRRRAWPVAASITLSSSALGAGDVVDEAALVHDEDAVGHAEHLGSSLETMTTAMPSAASCESSRCTSALVPTSMPRVGSSTISTRGSVDSHLARTTFCWLPPESVDTGSDSLPALTCSASPSRRPWRARRGRRAGRTARASSAGSG